MADSAKPATPWQRGEKTANTGLTAGEIAKAAGAVPSGNAGDSGTAGPAPRGVVAPGSSDAPTRAVPAAAPAGDGKNGESGNKPDAGDARKSSKEVADAARGPQGAGPKNAGPNNAGPKGAAPKGGAPKGAGPKNAGPKGNVPPAAPVKSGPAPSGPAPSGPAPAGPQGPPPKGGPGAGGGPVPPTGGPGPAARNAPPKPAGAAGPAGSPKPPGPPSAAPVGAASNPAVPVAKPADQRPDLDAIHNTKEAARATSRTIPASSIGTPLRAAVQVRRVDPWSVFKVTGMLAIAGFFIWMIAVAVLYVALAGMGVWDQINNSFNTLVTADGASTGGDVISTGQVFGFSALFGFVGAVILTALATILAYIYNVCSDTVGGIEVTLADLD